MMVNIDTSRSDTLTDQVVNGIRCLVDNHGLRHETRLPSIRQFAADHNVSKFTVVQAYDRLVASGYIESRPGSGFFVCMPSRASEPSGRETRLDKANDVLWLIHQQTREHRFKYLPGVGWLPPKWLKDCGLDRAMRALSRAGGHAFISGYGDPRGFAPLREYTCRRLAEFGMEVPVDQILLTNGISGAIDLVGRHLVRPGDAVLVDDPGYFHIFGHMRTLDASVHGVPWTSTGPDLETLENLARTHQPRLFITTPIVHNPTGQSISQHTAFRLLQLAERYDFYIIEDDVDGPCNPNPPPRLAGLDQLNRVIYVNGFSKTLSPRLRVGLVAGHRDLIRDLIELKLVTQAASSELAERLVHEVILSGQYRKHRNKLFSNLQQARCRALRRLEAMGLGLGGDCTHGLFAWMDVPGVDDTVPLAEAAARRGMLLAPGAMFSPGMTPSRKMRFNVAFCQRDAMFRLFDTLLMKQIPAMSTAV